MNEDLVLAITMLIILAVVVLFIQISQQIKVKRIQKMKIQRRFGEIPDMEEVLPIEKISVYHKHQGREDVDQVTWSDLSMDQVFQRIDQCDSAAGEAVLYNMLHCIDNGQAQWNFHGSEGRHHEGGELFSERNEISKKNAGALFRREADDLHY